MDAEQLKLQTDQYTYHFFFNHGLFDELMHYRDLIQETQYFINEKTINLNNSSGSDVVDERFGKKIQHENIFPNILWKSLFLSTYFLLENSLDQICNNLKISNSYNITIKDISGNGIFRSSLYLKKVCNINSPFQTNTWNKVMNLNKIRNILVHSNGILHKSNKELINICKNNISINLIDYDEENYLILFDNEFCKIALTEIEKLFYDIYLEMNKFKLSNSSS